ncbi:MAG: hypothetical protein GVY18_10110 [Bacteroidetes bacterium]|jgi:hypothetical protein|nr:hypothetical protein [Bacteroidota bacterium]
MRLLSLLVLIAVTLTPLAAVHAQDPPEDDPAPCSDDVYRQFDFWIGTWDVYNPKGERVGTNEITAIHGGCALREQWTSQGGGTGSSVNYYDPKAEAWNQLWVDGRGGIIDVDGQFADGAMRFEGVHIYPDGRVESYRMTFTPKDNGHVRQFIEQSKDDGETWYTWFDGLYVPEGETP